MKLGLRMRISTLAVLSTAAFVLLFSAGSPSLAVAEVTSDNAVQAVESAKTAADYEALAAYYRKLAEEQEARAKTHEKMLPRFKDFGKAGTSTDFSSHCKRIIEDSRKLKGEYEAIAKMYAQMAKDAGAK